MDKPYPEIIGYCGNIKTKRPGLYVCTISDEEKGFIIMTPKVY
jgi:hypothetical protein